MMQVRRLARNALELLKLVVGVWLFITTPSSEFIPKCRKAIAEMFEVSGEIGVLSDGVQIGFGN